MLGWGALEEGQGRASHESKAGRGRQACVTDRNRQPFQQELGSGLGFQVRLREGQRLLLGVRG